MAIFNQSARDNNDATFTFFNDVKSKDGFYSEEQISVKVLRQDQGYGATKLK